MNEDEIRQIIESIDPEGKISEEKIEALIVSIKELEKNPVKDGDKIGDYTFNTLQEQIRTETDWRKRSALAAKLISLGLE